MSKSKTGLAVLAGLGVLALGGVALAASGSKKSEPPVPKNSDEAALALIATLDTALKTESDPQKLRELAQYALLAVQQGAYSAEMTPKVTAAIQLVFSRADVLAAQQATTPIPTVIREVPVTSLQPVVQQQAPVTSLRPGPEPNWFEATPGKWVWLDSMPPLTSQSPGFVAPAPAVVSPQATTNMAQVIAAAAPEVQAAVNTAATAIAQGQPIPASALPDLQAGGILDALAATAAQAGASLPPQVVEAIAVVNQATAPAPTLTEVQQPTSLPDDTYLVLSVMLPAEKSPNWKRKFNESIDWQRNRGLVADGMFGPKSATLMAKETGLLPIVRYWPSGSYREGKWLGDYRAALLAEAAVAPEPRASQLRAAAQREQGQSWAPVQNVVTTISLE